MNFVTTVSGAQHVMHARDLALDNAFLIRSARADAHLADAVRRLRLSSAFIRLLRRATRPANSFDALPFHRPETRLSEPNPPAGSSDQP
ncbi:hypothetical protein V4C55_36980, partial [Paraburkholderia sabiae]